MPSVPKKTDTDSAEAKRKDKRDRTAKKADDADPKMATPETDPKGQKKGPSQDPNHAAESVNQ